MLPVVVSVLVLEGETESPPACRQEVSLTVLFWVCVLALCPALVHCDAEGSSSGACLSVT